ncbi:hypothetical protein DM02DRAFT_685119 [Periconia macrospinosa]|uniref:Rhodopsin domain-containing protein n=1 Tax=Periconia macrospinosa TaxID=97972 RepID=A0A2V1DID8_9PLEO|nr:hypothetical protein DM02DRAFT_685119 [Periconia macrospinosa]
MGTPMENVAPGNHSGIVIAVVTCLLSLATTVVVARIYTRCVLVKAAGSDDWGALISWIFTFGLAIDMGLATRHGFGYHTAALKIETLIEYLKYFFALIILYNLALTSIKISFLLQYRRVFSRTKMQILCNVGIAIVGSWGLFQILLTIFFCKPVYGTWDVRIKSKCLPRLPYWYVNAAFNIATDIAIFLLPLPGLRKLQLHRSPKRVLICVFCLGFFICIISIIRITTLKEASVTLDITWHNVATASWSFAELTCGITCLCIPTLRPLASRLFPGMAKSHWAYSRGARLSSAS